MERSFNGLGQLVETKDGNGANTRYAYDGAGNPIAIADPKMISMGNTVSIKTSFNAFGHKQWVEDPDWWDSLSNSYGSKVFSYNALGEVLNEIDPNGNIVEMTYDALGRVTERRVNGELEAKWHFDNPDTYKGLGLLDFEDSQFRPDGSRLQKFYYYSAATTGRKDLLQVTHRFYENNNPNDFTEYPTQYFTDGFYNRPKGLRYPGGTSVAYEYNSDGHLIKEKDPSSSVVYRNITALGSRFQVTAASVGNHSGSYKYRTTASYYPQTGQVESMSVTNGSTPFQTLSYAYDNFGNLSTRHTNVGGGTTETFSYDKLQRLTRTQRTYSSGSPGTVTYAYDAAGSFTSKSDYASTYTYGSSRPHAVTRANLAAGGSATFAYDQNGNLTQGHGENITYDAFNKPLTITNAAQTLQTKFTYGADLMRYRQVTPQGSRIYYIDKLMEVETAGSSSNYRHYLGDIAVLTKTGSLNDSNPRIKYAFRDRLGGISMLGDKSGTVTEYRAYDAFGKPRQSNWSDKSTPRINSGVTDRGFTDHEHLDDWQLIHMNGRGYDYNLGRFLSIDPFIQEPGNSQSINAYSYIMNNPLSGTDPSGYSCAAETGTRRKSCVDVNVGNSATGKISSTSLNQLHGGFKHHVKAFVSSALGNGANITSYSFTTKGRSSSSGANGTAGDGAPATEIGALGGLANRLQGQHTAGTLDLDTSRKTSTTSEIDFTSPRPSGLYVVGHEVGDKSWSRMIIDDTRHLAIEYVDENGIASWISAGPEFHVSRILYVYPRLKLIAGMDDERPTDQPKFNDFLGTILPPAGMSPGEYYNSRIVPRHLSYSQNLNYALFPAIMPSYNSNSYVATLIGSTGGRSSINFGRLYGGKFLIPDSSFKR
jgi:RHS repeat-associated protein